MTMVKTLVALATERMLLKTSGSTFLRGIEFMFAAGLAPERLSVMMTTSHKYVLQFHSKCDIRPFAANYPNFARVLRGIVHVRAWRIKSIEFVNVAFHMRDVENLDRAIEKLGVELVLLRNCTYPGVSRGDEAVKFLSALNRKKQAVVCEYGDDRLKHRISRRHLSNRRPSRLNQDMARLNADNERNDAGPNGAALPPVAAPQIAPVQNPLPPAQVIPIPHRNPEQMDQQVVALALQLINDQQAHLHGIYNRMQRNNQMAAPLQQIPLNNLQGNQPDGAPLNQGEAYLFIPPNDPRLAGRDEPENEALDVEMMVEQRPNERIIRGPLHGHRQAFADVDDDADLEMEVARAEANANLVEVEENSSSPQAALLR